jgi:histidine triad (HIT) family protein
MENCLFCKIARGEIPARKVYEDDLVVAFHDINPARPMHLLVIPKHHISSLQTARAADEPALGRMLAVTRRLAMENGSPDGFRVIINNGRIGGQEVPHLHAHVVGGPELVGPMLKRN